MSAFSVNYGELAAGIFSGQEPTNPDDLLKAFLIADLQDDLLRVAYVLRYRIPPVKEGRDVLLLQHFSRLRQ
jgi:hypothetical protein